MTPVDIDKLKELVAKATPRDWVVVPYGDGDSLVIHDARGDWRVCFMATPAKDGDFEGIEANANLIVAAVNALPMLIAKAERVDAMEAALKPFADRCDEAVHQNDDDRSGLTVRVEYLRAARNALSPTTTEDQHG